MAVPVVCHSSPEKVTITETRWIFKFLLWVFPLNSEINLFLTNMLGRTLVKSVLLNRGSYIFISNSEVNSEKKYFIFSYWSARIKLLFVAKFSGSYVEIYQVMNFNVRRYLSDTITLLRFRPNRKGRRPYTWAGKFICGLGSVFVGGVFPYQNSYQYNRYEWYLTPWPRFRYDMRWRNFDKFVRYIYSRRCL